MKQIIDNNTEFKFYCVFGTFDGYSKKINFLKIPPKQQGNNHNRI